MMIVKTAIECCVVRCMDDITMVFFAAIPQEDLKALSVRVFHRSYYNIYGICTGV